MKEIKCLDGEQYDINEKRCLSCDKYNLVWDPEYAKCKMVYKEKYEQIEKNIIVVDDKNEIVGYL